MFEIFNLPMDKMAAIPQTTFSDAFSWMILIQILVKFVPKVWIDSDLVLVQVMAWRQTGVKPLSEMMLT